MERYFGLIVSLVATVSLATLISLWWGSTTIPVWGLALASAAVGFMFGRLSSALDRRP